MTPKALNGRANHIDGNVLNDPRCPTCDQPLADKSKLVEIFGRLSAHDAEIEQAIAARFTAKLAQAETAKKREMAEAVRKATQTLRDGQAGIVAAAVQVERERSEKAVATAVAAATLEHTAEKTRLELALADALRKLQARAPAQLGEPLEAALFESLSAAFGSGVSRIAKGRNGPDLTVEIFDPGSGATETPIGCIAVEAKNVSTWSSKIVPKLKADARALNAEWAICVTVSAYPREGTRGLCVIDGIVVVSDPSYVPGLIELMRRQIVEMHRQKLTGKARNQKAAALLDFIGSSGCADLLQRFAVVRDRLLEIEQKEQTAHATVWKRRGELIRSLQQAHQELVATFDSILGGRLDVVKGAAI